MIFLPLLFFILVLLVKAFVDVATEDGRTHAPVGPGDVLEAVKVVHKLALHYVPD